MKTYMLERSQLVPRTLEETFAFFSDPRNLEAITPASLRFRIVDAPAQLHRGARLHFRLRLLGIPFAWHSEITDWDPPRGFTDVQRAGPYVLWRHTHSLAAHAGGTLIEDRVRYLVPGGPLAPLLERAFVRRRLDAIFDYRQRRLRELLGGRDNTPG